MTVMYHRVLLALYAVAAAASLAHETLWMKRLALLFGMSLPAVATAIALFVLGMALGGALVGRFFGPGHAPARWLAVLQGGVGAWACGMPWLFEWVAGIYTALAPAELSAAHHALRVGLAALVVLPPATALGATFPVVSALGVGRAFALGTAGSVAGVIGAVVVLIPALGLAASFRSVGSLNLAVGAVALGLGRGAAGGEAAHAGARRAGAAERLGPAALQVALLGAALFAAQAAWFRLMGLVVASTFYAEGALVAAVLVAMTLGAACAVRWRPPIPWVLAGTALAQLALIPLAHPIARAWEAGRPLLGGSFPAQLLGHGILALAIVGPAAAGYGLAIPLLCRGFSPRAVGRLWGLHHVGGALGALVAAFGGIAVAGITGVLALGAAAAGAAAWLGRARFAAVAIVACALVGGAFGDATFRHAAAGASQEVIFHHEGGAGIVEVVEDRRTGHRRMLSNRLRQEGGDAPEQVRAQRIQGRLPLRLQPDAERVLAVGLGTGISLDASLDETVDRLTCVEISKGVIAASELFSHANGAVLEDPRVRLVRQDGRNFVRLTEKRYDLIVQDLFHAYRAGAGALYAREHFARCRDRLAPGGRMAQWLHTIQVTPDALRSIAASFADVFPSVSLWFVNGQLLMIGGEEPVSLAASSPALQRFVAGDEAVRRWVRGAPLNTEDNLSIAHRLPRAFDRLNETSLAVANLEALLAIQQSVRTLDPGLPARISEAARLRYRGIVARHRGNRDKAFRLYRRAHEKHPGNPAVKEFLLRESLRRERWATALRFDPDHPAANHNRGVELYREEAYAEAAKHFRRALDASGPAVDAAFNLANCHARLGRYGKAKRLYRRVLRRRPGHESARRNLEEVLRVSRRREG